MVRQIRQGRIQAVGLSSVGLSRIDNGVSCLQVPMMFRSYDELDYVRDRLAPTLERRIEAKGFKVLNWADGGWVHTFTKRPARTPDDVRRMKLFTSAGDPDTERLYKDFGFQVVPLSQTDMVTSLQTGMIEAFSTVPLFAQLQESYKLAPYMIDVLWMPLVGGTVISQKTWDQIPAAYRAPMLEAARGAGARLRSEIRAMGDDAVRAMAKRGLQVIAVDAATRALWQSSAERAYPQLRGSYCPAESVRRGGAVAGRVPSRPCALSPPRTRSRSPSSAAMTALALVEVGGRLTIGRGIPGSIVLVQHFTLVGGDAGRGLGRPLRPAGSRSPPSQFLPPRVRAQLRVFTSTVAVAVSASLCARQRRPGSIERAGRRHRRLGHPVLGRAGRAAAGLCRDRRAPGLACRRRPGGQLAGGLGRCGGRCVCAVAPPALASLLVVPGSSWCSSRPGWGCRSSRRWVGRRSCCSGATGRR